MSANEFSPIAGLSHEIRTPLVGILGMAQLLAATDLTEQQRHLLEGIFEGGEALLATLDGMIELCQLEAGAVAPQIRPLETRAWLESACDLLRPQADAKGLSIVAHCEAAVPRWVKADAGRLRQILLNLLSNAIRHSRQGQIEVRLTWSEATERLLASLELKVQDQGEGIDDEVLVRLFSPRPGRRVADRGRAGLGLAICHRLARIMGGEMWVLSHGGQGCTFHLRLPAEVVDEGSASPFPRPGGAGRFDPSFAVAHPMAILVVDDDPVNRKVITMFLERLGYAAQCAAGGAEALALLSHSALDLVLLDLEMPGLDGTGVARAVLAGHGSTPRPYLAAVTAHVLDRSPEHLRALGMDDFLGKPFRIEDLRTLIERAERWRLAPAGPLASNP